MLENVRARRNVMRMDVPEEAMVEFMKFMYEGNEDVLEGLCFDENISDMYGLI